MGIAPSAAADDLATRRRRRRVETPPAAFAHGMRDTSQAVYDLSGLGGRTCELDSVGRTSTVQSQPFTGAHVDARITTVARRPIVGQKYAGTREAGRGMSAARRC